MPKKKTRRAKKPAVSVIMVNYNGQHLLHKAITSLQQQSFRKGIEIIIVDNGSTDDSKVFVQKNFPKVVWVDNPANEGYPAANHGVSVSKGDYILFSNNDVEFHKDCVKNMYTELTKNKKAGMVTPKLINFYDRKIDSKGTWISRGFYCGHTVSDSRSFHEHTHEIPYMGIGLLSKKLIKKLGYMLDLDYFLYAEDVDLSLRIRTFGLQVLYVPSSIIYHVHAATMGKHATNVRRTYLMERNLLTTFVKLPTLPRLLLYTPYVVGLRIASVLKDLLTLNFSVALARVKALVWVLLHLPSILKKRFHVQRNRKASDAFLFAPFSEKALFGSLSGKSI